MWNIFGRLCWRGEHGQTQSAFPIPAAQTLIDRLDLDGKRVDLDALHPQDLTAQKLFFERGADCVMTVKANQKSLYQTLETKLQGNCSGRFPAITSTDHLWLGDPKGSDIVVRTVPCAAPSQETPLPHSPLCGSEPVQSPSAQGTVRTTFADIPGVFARGDIHRRAAKKQLLQVIGGPGKLFLPVGAKTCFGGEAPMQQGRQECRPSDGPATLLSPMVGMEACFALKKQLL